MELDQKKINTRLSVILPIYNQADHIPYLFENYSSKLNQLNESWELLFIVNGSKDDSYKTALNYASHNPNVRAYNLEQGGWGRAVKFGIQQAKGSLICYTNSARTHPDDLVLILKYALVNDNIVIKTTRVVRENFIRKIGSILYNYENRLLTGTPLWDVNGTPKVIPAKYLSGINILFEDDLIDAEIMAKVFRQGIPIVEILILSTRRISGKSTTNFLSAWKMYKGLLRLKKNL